MKRIIAYFLAILISLNARSQLQRLAALPKALQITEDGLSYIPSLCLDFFREGPSGSSSNYKFFSDVNSSSRFESQGTGLSPSTYDRLDIDQAKKIDGFNSDRINFLSTEDDLQQLSTKKKEFVESLAKLYEEQGNYSAAKHEEFQEKIWAMDILEQLDYIDPGLNGITAYEDGLRKFSRDFLPEGVRADATSVLEVGDDFKLFIDNPSKPILVYKSKRTGEFLVYTRIGRHASRGTDLTAIAQSIGSQYRNDDLVPVKLINFTSATTEKSFLLSLQRRLRVRSNKDVILSTDIDGFSWSPSTYEINRGLTNISSTTNGQSPAFTGSVQLTSSEALFVDETLTVTAISNKRPAISTFFERLTSWVRTRRDNYILGRQARRIKREVKEGLNLSNEDYLDVLITEEGGSKSILRIRKNSVEMIGEYAQN